MPSVVIYSLSVNLDKNNLKRAAAKRWQNLAEMFKKKKLSIPTSINPTTSISVVLVPAVENPARLRRQFQFLRIGLRLRRKCLLLSQRNSPLKMLSHLQLPAFLTKRFKV